MTNIELLAQSYTNVLQSLADYASALDADKTVEELEEDMAIVEKLSVILKRIGETQILENVNTKEVGDGVDERE